MAADSPGIMDDVWRRYEELTGKASGRNAQALGQSVLPALEYDPDTTARARGIAKRSGIPLPVVEADPAWAEREARMRELDLGRISRESPATAGMLEDPGFAEVSHDAIEELEGLEQEMGWLARQRAEVSQRFARGQRVVESGNLLWAEMWGQGDEFTASRLRALQAEDARMADTDLDGFWEGIPGAMAEMAPFAFHVTLEGAKGGAAAAPIGAAGGAASGFAVAGGPGAAAGARFGASRAFQAGSALASLYATASVEGGHAYGELRDMRDENGNPLDPNIAKGLAVSVGVVNGLLERFALRKVLQFVPGAQRVLGAFGPEATRRAISNPTVRGLAAKLGLAIFESAATEGVTEGMQEATVIAAVHAGRAVLGDLSEHLLLGKPIEGFTHTVDGVELTGWDAIQARVLESAIQGAQGGGGLAGATGAVASTAELVASSEKAQDAIERLPVVKQVTKRARESKLRQRDPAAAREHARRVGQDAGVDTVYISREDMQEFLQAAAPDVRQQILESVPAIREQAGEAVGAGTDFAIPFEDFFTEIAPIDGGDALADKIRFDPDDLSGAEAIERVESLTKELGSVEELVDLSPDEQAARDTLRQELTAQIGAAYPQRVVAPLVDFTMKRIETRAARKGQTVQELIAGEDLFRTEVEQGAAGTLASPVPSLRERLSGEAIRRVLRDMRENRDTAEGLPALPVLATLRDLGGVDPAGELGAALAELDVSRGTMPGLLREGGLGAADQIVGNENPFLEAADVIGEGGVADVDRLVEAIRNELAGRPVRTVEQGEMFARTEEERADLEAAMDAAGLDLEATDDEIVAALTEQEFAQPSANAMKVPGLVGVLPFLTDLEADKLKSNTAKTLMDAIAELPDIDSVAAAAVAGQAKRGWYRKSAKAIVDIFGLEDAPRFALLLAALSPQTSVESNLVNALNVWTAWINEGRPTDRKSIVRIMGENVEGDKGEESILGAWQNNTVRALSTADPINLVLSGPKVNSFAQNLRDNVNAVTVDSWEFLVFGRAKPVSGSLNVAGTDPGTVPVYAAISARVRQVAQVLTERTGETWTPREVQETTWSFAKAIVEKAESAGEERSIVELAMQRAVTDEEIASVPDFAQLLVDEFYRGILERGGYDVDSAITGQSDQGNVERAVSEEQAVPSGFDEALQRIAETIERTREERRRLEAEDEAVEFNQERRGSIRGLVTADGELSDLNDVVIRLFETRDLTTFLHESGHLWLAQLAKDAAEVGGELQRDLDTAKAALRSAVGTDDLASEAAQEQWATWVEQYIMEGRSPSLELESVMGRFRAWFVRVYQQMKQIAGFQGPLSPEIRDVMDRLIATDEEISDALIARELRGMDAGILGLTEEQAAEYATAVDDARVDAAAELDRQKAREFKREATAAWKELRAKVRKEVEADVNSRPLFQAKHWLQRGESLPGQPEVNLRHARLDRAALVAMYQGEEILKILRPGAYGVWGREGYHPDAVAEVFQIADGRTLVDGLAAIGKREDIIEQETDALMEKRHGRFENSEAVEAAVVDALESSKQIRVLQIEERALARRAGTRATPEQVARRVAREVIQATPEMRLKPHRYRVAAKKAGREAIEHAAEGRFAEAQAAKGRQIVAFFMESEARKAQQQTKSTIRMLNAVQTPKRWGRIGKAGHTYQDQIENLLARFNLRIGQSIRKIEKKQRLDAWMREQEDQGIDVAVPASMVQYADDNGQLKTSWRELTVAEIQDLGDAVTTIEHLARLKNEFLDKRDRRSIEKTRGDMLESLEQNTKSKTVPNTVSMREDEIKRQQLRGWDAHMAKAEFVALYLDGGKAGHWTENVINPVNDVTEEINDVSRKFTQKTGDLLLEYLKPRLNEYLTDFAAPEFDGRPINKIEMLMIALNFGSVGNYSNTQRLIDGNELKSENAIQAFLDSNMTREDWQFVKRVWKLVGELKPMIWEDAKRRNGYYPKEVETRTIKTPFGDIEGQYFPIFYDGHGTVHTPNQDAESLYGEFNLGFQAVNGLVGNAMERQARVSNRPLQLDLSVLPRHIDEVVRKTIARHRLQQVYRLVKHDSVKKAFQRSNLGESYYHFWLDWLREIAGDTMIEDRHMRLFSSALRHVRLGYTVSRLALRTTTIVGQALGNINAAGVLRNRLPNWRKHYLQGVRKATGGLNPQRLKRTYQKVLEVSLFMRQRLESIDRETRDIMKRNLTSQVTATGRVKKAVDSAAEATMKPIIWSQFASVDIPVWLAAYDGAQLELGYTEDQARRFADSVVRTSQGAADAKDLSAIQRSKSEMYRMWSTFYSYKATQYNQVAFSLRKAAGLGDVPAAIADMMFFLMMPAIAYQLMREVLTGHGGPDEDADALEWGLWATGVGLSELLGTIWLVREAESLPTHLLGGGPMFDSSVPTQEMIGQIRDLAHSKDEAETFFDAVNLLAPLTYGFPPEAPTRALEKKVRGE